MLDQSFNKLWSDPKGVLPPAGISKPIITISVAGAETIFAKRARFPLLYFRVNELPQDILDHRPAFEPGLDPIVAGDPAFVVPLATPWCLADQSGCPYPVVGCRIAYWALVADAPGQAIRAL
jgi:hypothetical protein